MTENTVKYEYSLREISIINGDNKINEIMELTKNSENIGSVNVFFKRKH